MGSCDATALTCVHFFQALDLSSIKSHEWKIWSCSAVTGQNLLTGLDWVVNNVASRLYYSTAVAASIVPIASNDLVQTKTVPTSA